MSLSTHVLNAVTGRPTAQMAVRLEVRGADGWSVLGTRHTNIDGRIPDFTADPTGADPTAAAPTGADPTPAAPTAGVYRLIFDIEATLGADTFYPEVVITFTLADASQHYHVPLLLSPYAYSTYRGS